ncbi:hypothetical protein ABZY90_28875 [Streptomyces sp. NPDC006422]|uniref:hypothetical protein n=1 Tax=unclassified Streptomyces TaxID=2593676 RepID=UPI0033AA1808
MGEGKVYELVVPGVGALDRGEVLLPDRVGRVSGDRQAGVYRGRIAGGGQRAGVQREVYDWAALTSGGAMRSLWLFLLPFLLVNVAGWMRPHRPTGRPLSLMYGFGVRLLGLSMTVLLVGGLAQVTMDQLVWQCRSSVELCSSGNDVVAAVRDMSVPTGLLVAMTVPLVGLFLAAWAAGDERREYGTVWQDPARIPSQGPRPSLWRRLLLPPPNGQSAPLEVYAYWQRNTRAEGLMSRHLCAGVLTLAVLTAMPPASQGGDQAIAVVLFVVIGALGAWTLVGTGPWRLRRMQVVMVTGCLLVLVWAVLYCLMPGPRWATTGRLPGLSPASGALLGAQFGGVALTALSAVPPLRSGRRRTHALYGLSGPVTALMGCLLGWICASALALWARGWLHSASAPDGAELLLPQAALKVVAACTTVLLLGLALVSLAAPLVAALRWYLRSMALLDAWPDIPPGTGPFKRQWVLRARYRAERRRAGDPVSEQRRTNLREELDREGRIRLARRLTDHGPKAVDVLFGVAAVAFVLVLAGLYLVQEWENAVAVEFRARVTTLVQFMVSLAGVFLVAMIAVLLFTARSIAIRRDARENAGLAWAFGAFWPRSAHPFAPAAWTVRAVPELVQRIDHLLSRDPRDRLLLQANSLGSVLAVFALWQTPPEHRRRVALLTTGCPLTLFFTGHYPAYAVHERIAPLAASLAAWTNVRRDTDPLAGDIGVPGVRDVVWHDATDPYDPPPPDPEAVAAQQTDRGPHQPVFRQLEGHTSHRADPRIDAERDALLGVLARLDGPHL